MQDGVKLHTANFMLDLNTFFGPHIMSNRYPDQHNCGNFWPHIIHDLNPCDFFLRGFLKEEFVQKQSIELEMTGMLAELCRGLRKICVAMLLQTCCQLQEVIQRNDGHIRHILTKKLYTNAEQYVKSW
jgi:hypothetical protein